MQQFNPNSFNSLSLPLQQIVELNKKTFEKFSYLKAEDFQTNNPQILVEKSVQVFIDNSHKSLDYMHQLFNIWEKLSQESREKTQDVMKKSQSYASSISKDSRSSAKRAHGKSSSPLRREHSSSNSNKSPNSPSRNAAQHTASSDKKHDAIK
ncbi:hypothetical protein [Legionella parisiensis]|uniref:Phasin domain-containing protein n=1 Tax=Legionella parisiensis TaxID=45071 RepID=A0A1E5JWD6_9GAMM|nr:hypothetical protein [Legionella parisiensis]KTD41803.1 hypothetical protein Lpar_3120 [Legionella parisiensis]OEH48847.1 hypothetical protein lpari_00094 [Legionella parisiensis]STX75871.1 Uncharacterised protein [Legionella parisiensis]